MALFQGLVRICAASPGCDRLAAMNERIGDVVRASVHYYNTEDELDRLVAALPSP